VNQHGASVGHLEFRLACSRFPTGITVLTAIDVNGRPCGITVSSFTSVSLQPPLILACIDTRSQMMNYLAARQYFGVNVLSDDQQKLSEQFARNWMDRFVDVVWQPGRTGVPLLPNVSAAFECEAVELRPAGDHVIVIGQVLHVTSSARPSLVYVNSSYNRLGSTESPKKD
jgi:flavin reductase (DIM6/NTAB) family NADH-FMN oxidoreductase RutF